MNKVIEFETYKQNPQKEIEKLDMELIKRMAKAFKMPVREIVECLVNPIKRTDMEEKTSE